MKFEDLGLNDWLLEALSYMGFNEATPIQEKTIPSILDRRDLIACAQTGTGKTAAFILPILHMLEGNTKAGVKAMVIAPTRELALQIDQQIQGFAYFTNLRSIAVYGGGDGADWDQQKKALNMGVDIVVATPGKLISHLNMGYTEFKNFECLILDEADRMLDMGFSEDIRKIISYLPKKRQNLFFSATMPPKIRKLAKEVLEDPLEVSIAISKPAENILQASYLVYDEQKIPLLTELLKGKEKYESVIIFASRKKKVNEICRALRKHLDSVEGISSDLDQKEREKVVERFRSKRTRIVVSTDVLSRGIDIKDINLVINFDVPNDAEDYVHRIGRTARANTSGVAITLINKDDMSSFNKIERLIEKDVFKVPLPDHLGEGPKWDLSRRHYGKPKRHKSHRN